MACPKFDRHNKKHVIIASVVAVSIVLIIIAIIVVVVVLLKTDTLGPGADSKSNSTSGRSGSDLGPGADSNSGSAGSNLGPDSGFSEMETAGANLHNKYRSTHHADPLTLSKELNSLAQECAEHYAKKGTIDHSCKNKQSGGARLGENLYYAGVLQKPSEAKIAEDGVTSWYNEVKMYDFASGGFSRETGHFTQLVWKGSNHLGLGMANKNEKQYFFVALYKPAGNVRGQYQQNVLPE